MQIAIVNPLRKLIILYFHSRELIMCSKKRHKATVKQKI